VLLVDDDALEIFGLYLRYTGAAVTTARNGAEALARVEETRAHVIVTDLSMPVMDGVEFVRRLRGYRGQDTAPTPVIAVSAFPQEYSPKRVADAGFRSYLVKPVDPERVALEVRRIFESTYGLEDYGGGRPQPRP
jgi:CheY-like chemotaxis protein